jgi:hypothetical protein
MSSCICGIDAVARGSYVGGRMPIAAYAAVNSRSMRYASAHHGSASVAFCEHLVVDVGDVAHERDAPVAALSQRRSRSNASAARSGGCRDPTAPSDRTRTS